MSDVIRDIVQGNISNICHTVLQRPRIHIYEDVVSTVVGLSKYWDNPFVEKQGIISISTANTAPRDLLKAYDIGEQAYAIFKCERLERYPLAKKFHDPKKTIRLKTFSNMCKKKEVKSSGRVTILKADIYLFGRDGTRTQSPDG